MGADQTRIALFGLAREADGLRGDTDDDGDGASPINLWAPRAPNASVVRTPAKCTVCVENRFKNEACLVQGHPCMRELRPAQVIGALARALGMRDTSLV